VVAVDVNFFSVFFFGQCNDALLVNEGKQNHRKTYPCICEYDCAAHVEGLKQAHCHSWLMTLKLQAFFHGFDSRELELEQGGSEM